jgi:hypothetical protein
MRNYAIGRRDYYHRLRTQLVTIAIALLPVSIAAASLFYTAIGGKPKRFTSNEGWCRRLMFLGQLKEALKLKRH